MKGVRSTMNHVSSELSSSDSSRLDADRRRLLIQVQWSWEKEFRTLEWFGLRDGMAVLELGSGPGFITEQLLGDLPQSTITAVEISSAFLDWSKNYLCSVTDGRVHFVQASVEDTGLPDNSMDFAIARYLFQHLSDPVPTARECLRVLKPGGKLVVIDNDSGMYGVFVPSLQQIIAKRAQFQQHRGGDINVGRRLWRILRDVGFQQLDLESIVFHSDHLGIDAFRQHFHQDRLTPLVQLGLVSEQELRQVHSEIEQFFASPESLIIQTLLMMCGTKGKG